MTGTRIPASEAGCWLDGSQGWHNTYRVVDRAFEWGWDPADKELIEKVSEAAEAREETLTGWTEEEEIDVHEVLTGPGGYAERATEYLQSIAPAGYTFEWDAGELDLVKTGRTAVIQRYNGRPAAAEVAKYLPYNYEVVSETAEAITITGEDDAGWSLDGYVIPRLGSGWITAREVEE